MASHPPSRLPCRTESNEMLLHHRFHHPRDSRTPWTHVSRRPAVQPLGCGVRPVLAGAAIVRAAKRATHTINHFAAATHTGGLEYERDACPAGGSRSYCHFPATPPSRALLPESERVSYMYGRGDIGEGIILFSSAQLRGNRSEESRSMLFPRRVDHELVWRGQMRPHSP